MKSVALILCLAIAGTWAASLEGTHHQTIQEIRAKCQSDTATHVDDTIWEKVQKDEHVEFPANWGAHIFCITKGMGLQHEDGSINEEGIRAKVAAATTNEEAINKTVKACAVTKDTPELTARALLKCFHNLDKQHSH